MNQENIFMENFVIQDEKVQELVKHAASFVSDFDKSHVKLVPIVCGELMAHGSKKGSKQVTKFFVMQPSRGALIKFNEKVHFE
jgi:hypothetical protein